jgi:uncharacterized membrane protein
LIWWLADEKMKKNSFVTHHVKQWLVLLIVTVAVNIVGGVVPILGWFIILPLGNLLVFIWWIQGLILSIQGSTGKLFWIGQYGDKFTF